MKKTKLLISVISILTIVICLFALSPMKVSAESEYKSGYYTYTVEDGKATITGFDESISGNITVPSTLGGYPVTEIGSEAFYYCVNLTNITLPDGITKIGDYAFFNSGLTNITIPTTVKTLGYHVFDGCGDLRYNEYDNAYYLGNSTNPYIVLVKAKSKTITSCNINANTKIISPSAFYKCSDLTSISIPNSVTSIGAIAFAYCSALTNITIPNSVTRIDGCTFSHCSSLTSIIIPDSVTSIGNDAFSECSSLTSVSIGNGVKYIDEDAFFIAAA